MSTVGAAEDIYEALYVVLYKFAIPTVSAFGMLGNVMILAVFSRMGTSSVYSYLRALAVADLLFCTLALFSITLPSDEVYALDSALLYYRLSAHGLINVFIMASTWLTVSLACERYIAVCHPYSAHRIIKLHRTIAAIVMVYVFSVIFNLPIFWRFEAFAFQNATNTTTMVSVREVFVISAPFDLSYRILWSIIGNIIPLVLLSYCNIRLVRSIRESNRKHRLATRHLVQTQNTQKQSGSGSEKNGQAQEESGKLVEMTDTVPMNQSNESPKRSGRFDFLRRKTLSNSSEDSRDNTITLIFIALCFLVMVAPSEVARLIVLAGGAHLGSSFEYKTVEIFFNFMQCVNFAINFILYASVNQSFRAQLSKFCARLPCFRTDQ